MFILTVKYMKQDYEVKYIPANWELAKYLMQNKDLFTKKDSTGIVGLYEEIMKQCVVEWRNTSDKTSVFIKELKNMPSTIAMTVINFIMEQANTVAEVRIEQEKK